MTVTVPYVRRGDAIPFSNHVEVLALSTAEETMTVPSAAQIAVIQGDGGFAVRAGTTVATPADSTGDGTGEEIVGGGSQIVRKVTPGSTLHFVSASTSAVNVSASFYLDPSLST